MSEPAESKSREDPLAQHDLPCDMHKPLWLLMHNAHLHWTHYQLLYQTGIAYLMDRCLMDLIAMFPFLVTWHSLSLARQSKSIVLHGQGVVVVSSQICLVLNFIIIICIWMACIYHTTERGFPPEFRLSKFIQPDCVVPLFSNVPSPHLMLLCTFAPLCIFTLLHFAFFPSHPAVLLFHLLQTHCYHNPLPPNCTLRGSLGLWFYQALLLTPSNLSHTLGISLSPSKCIMMVQ